MVNRRDRNVMGYRYLRDVVLLGVAAEALTLLSACGKSKKDDYAG